jgi:hypothetical protein
MLSLLRSLGLGTGKAIRKPNTNIPALVSLEDRITPVVTALYNSTSNLLTINFQNANDTATVTYDSTADGYRINAGGSAITILGGYNDGDNVDRLVIRDSGDSARGQKVTLGTSITDNFSVDNGVSITGIESVILDKSITVASDNGVSITGATTSIQLGADITADDLPVVLDGPVVLSANVTIDTDNNAGGANVSFTGTVNSATSTPRNLTVTAGTGSVSFGDKIGATQSLAVVDITGGSISLTGNVTSSGNITFTGNLTLNRNVTISSTSGDITFTGTIDSDTSGTPRSLTLGTPSQGGATTFGDSLGATNRLGAVTVHRTGTISIAGDISTANAAVSFKGEVALTGNSSIITKTGSNVGGNVSFQFAVNGAQDLTVDAGSNGTVSFGSTVGASTNLVEIQLTAKTIAIGGNITSNNNDITLTGAVILNSSPTISSTGGAITLNGSVNGSAINTRSLFLDSGDGDITVNAVVGNLRRLLEFKISDAVNVAINNSITATTISITADGGTDDKTTISVTGNATLVGSTAITSKATDETYIDVSGRFNGSVSVTGSGSIKSELRATSNSNFTVTGTDVTDRSKGTLKKTQPGRPAVITFTNIRDLAFTGGASGNAFTLNEWFFPADINGAGGSDSLIVNRAQDATSGLEFTLDNSNLQIDAPTGSFSSGTTSPISLDYALTSIESANIVAGAGDDSFDIGGWTARATLAGGSGADQLIWSATADSVLTPTSFVAGSLNASLSRIESANLENTGTSSKFSITGFVGNVDITGDATTSTVTATYNANFALVGTSATDGTITTGGTTITFTAGNVSLIGGNRDNTFSLNGTYLGVVNLDGGQGNDTYNITLPLNTNTTNLVTVSDTGSTTRDIINATGTGGALTRTLRTLPLLNLIRYGAEGATDRPGIDYKGVEIVNLL